MKLTYQIECSTSEMADMIRAAAMLADMFMNGAPSRSPMGATCEDDPDDVALVFLGFGGEDLRG